MSRTSWSLLLALLAVLAPGAGTASAASTPRHGPAGAAFYTPPSKLPAGRHGALIWTRAYEGLGTPGTHPYLVGLSEGRSTLDIVRAAHALDPRISARKVIISGHSQGGHAALFAAALAPDWTPELGVRGTVAFAPVSHVDDQIPLTTGLTSPGGGLSGLISIIARGIAAVTPALDTNALLSDEALALYPQTLTQCLPELSTPASFGGQAPASIFRAGADLAPVAAALDAQDSSHLKIRTPLLIEQGAADTTVFPQFTAQLDTELKANGAKPVYRTYAGVDHGGVVTAAAKDATSWIAKRLR
ncbi:hypothetical protein FSW04_21775 [Baekduia soli]|uniref:Prolyl oligopeptidase family serine peptidase n=1 Tax=Baekduia soli TaxID=496014 RepID=A0A5B8U9T2_9ACTN|nr:lipase family protein [Baekduia soli]QEC49933.1 hypothetical protein FSW04_21775 [Baekduia soli]